MDERAPQFLIVVDLAVEHDPDRPILVADRLLAAVEIDDSQTAHPQSGAWAEVDAFFVGTAVHQHPAHRPNFALEDRFAVKANDSSNATHDGFPLRFPAEESGRRHLPLAAVARRARSSER